MTRTIQLTNGFPGRQKCKGFELKGFDQHLFFALQDCSSRSAAYLTKKEAARLHTALGVWLKSRKTPPAAP